MKVELPSDKFLQPGTAGVVVLATCVDERDEPNIITLGMYMPISINPPMVCIGVAPQRYSHDLIENSGEFVINTPPIQIEDEMHFCGVKSGRDVDKFQETGLTPIPSKVLRPPRIKECFGHMECRVIQEHTCGDHTLFVGEVVAATANKEVLDNGSMNPLKAQPIIQKNHIYYTLTKEK